MSKYMVISQSKKRRMLEIIGNTSEQDQETTTRMDSLIVKVIKEVW